VLRPQRGLCTRMHDTGHNTHRRSPWRRTISIIGVAVVIVITVGTFLLNRKSSDQLLQNGVQAFERGDSSRALGFAEKILQRDPHSIQALYLAAKSCKELDRLGDAVGFYDRIPDDGSLLAVDARCASGNLLLSRMKPMMQAIGQFRRAVAQDPDNLIAHSRLASLLGLSSRTWEAAPHRLEMIRLSGIDVTQLYLLAVGEAAVENPNTIRQFSDANPDDPAMLLASARLAALVKDYRQAKTLLRNVLRANPQLIEAQTQLGTVLLELKSDTKFLEWNANLPEAALSHPRVWFVRGKWAAAQDDPQGAIRCFWEAVQRDPNYQRAVYELGQALVSAGKKTEAEAFLERAEALANYVKTAELVKYVGDPHEFRNCVKLAESLGLHKEALGWAYAAASEYGVRTPWTKKTIQRLLPLSKQLPSRRTSPGVNPASALAAKSYALPSWSAPSAATANRQHPAQSPSQVTFRNDASTARLDFQYYNAGDPQNRGIVHMYEVVGGGVAVLDFDSDGWPDLYFPQGCRWPPKTDRAEHTDHLKRNRGDGTFEDVTVAAGLVDSEFSQGATVGDFNSDGFADIYVANIGLNRLYRNNGDGTYTDVTPESGVAGNRYTTSCLIADLNGDALPDIYVVNYLSGDDLFTRVCGDKGGVHRSCLPQLFDGSSDRLFLNLGDGRFTDCSSTSGIDVSRAGKGLGIVATDLDASGRLSLFVANDVGPNFLFVNQTGEAGRVPEFVESGLAAGLALNRDGNYESGMGIAAGDVDNDGLLDIFVTNFDNETNTLYRQLMGGRFSDETVESGFGRKRNAYVGWGAQFIDGELDGLPDLLVTNGHVNDLRDHGKPYRMPVQYFNNTGAGQFAEGDPSKLGPFFEKGHLGRGMARIDWNRDGLEDVAISLLDAPAALLTNRTTRRGRSFTCRLIAVDSARDAIGTTVVIRAGDMEWARQLTAGDGNQSSNQRILVFGLGPHESVDEVEIRWPSGQVSRHSQLTSDREFVFVEGREPFTLPR
jgi:tetratricopeptide (TPR) repeat protein